MSINSAMLAGVSGLVANSTALAAISDNIANVNTVGYKRNQADFQTLVTAKARTGWYNAGGVMAQTRQLVSAQGNLQRSASSTDLAISGNGFFVTTARPEDVTAADSRTFTRAGAFTPDEMGFLRNSEGGYLQGWPADTQGVISPDPSDLTRLRSINISAIGGTAEPTTRIGLSANLKASQAVSTAAAAVATNGAGAYNAATNSMAAYDPTTGAGVKPDYEIQVPVSDSKGGQRTIAMSFLKSANANEWHVEIRAVPADQVTTGAPLANGQIKTGVVAFTPSGRIDPAKTTLFNAADPSLTFGPSAAGAPGAGGVNWAAGLGVAGQTIRFDLASATAGLTQFDSQSVSQAITTNGTNFGNLTQLSIDEQGFVTAEFDNGVTRRIAQVAVATFANPDGLRSISGNAYRVSSESGVYNLKTPGTGGAGEISPSTLEASTVDLSSEFTGLITTQRAYSASSKIITTADEMLEQLLSIKR